MKPRLTNSEVVLLRSWLWERSRGMTDGPSHKLAEEHGLILEHGTGVSLAALHAELKPYLVERIIDLTRGPQPQIPREWPWPVNSGQEVAHYRGAPRRRPRWVDGGLVAVRRWRRLRCGTGAVARWRRLRCSTSAVARWRGCGDDALLLVR